MISRPRPRETRAAAWALRLATLPIPLLIIGVLLHRAALIAVAPLVVVIGLAWLLAALALVAAAIAFRAIWQNGDRGTARAVVATLLAVVVLSVPAVVVVELVRLPRIADVSTDATDPPLFTAAPDSVAMRPLPNEAERAAQVEAYPDIVPRHYLQSSERVYQAITSLVAARGWTVTDARAPDTDNEVGWIEATATTVLLALPVDVAIRIVADGQGSLVDMRSASRIGAHDLGDNAGRIRAFFADLDSALQGVTEPEDDGRPLSENGDDPAPLPPLPLPPPAPVSRR